MRQNIILFILMLLMNYYGFSQSIPISIEIKKVASKNFEIIIHDSTDGHPLTGKDDYFYSTTNISIKNDSLNKITFSYKVFGDVEVVPYGDSVKSPSVSFILKNTQVEIFVFFKTEYYGTKIYHFQGTLDPTTNKIYKYIGANIIKNDRSENIFYFNENEYYRVYTEVFCEKIAGPFLIKN